MKNTKKTETAKKLTPAAAKKIVDAVFPESPLDPLNPRKTKPAMVEQGLATDFTASAPAKALRSKGNQTRYEKRAKAAKAAPAAKGKVKAKPAAKSAPKANGAPALRDGSKGAKIVALISRKGGATATELQKAAGWQAHSVRGFLSAVAGKKLGLKISATRAEGVTTYTIA